VRNVCLTLREKHNRRKTRANSIIERRLEQLKHGDELSWIQAATAHPAEREETQLSVAPSQKGGGYFATPMAAATEIAARLTAHDFAGFVNLLPDAVVMENAGRLAGMAQIYDVCGQAGMPVPAGFELLILKLEESKLAAPPAEAVKDFNK